MTTEATGDNQPFNDPALRSDERELARALAQLRALQPSAQARERILSNVRERAVMPRRTPTLPLRWAGIMVTLALLVCSVATFRSLPGEALYPARRSVEELQLRLAPGDAPLRVTISETRLNAVQQLVQRGASSEQIGTAITEYQLALGRLAPGTTTTQALATQAAVLAALREPAPAAAQHQIDAALMTIATVGQQPTGNQTPLLQPTATPSPQATERRPTATARPVLTSTPPPTSTEQPAPTEAAEPTPRPAPIIATERPKPTQQPEPTSVPKATERPEPTTVPEATERPRPSERPEETKPPAVTERPEPTKRPEATERPEPTRAPDATDQPRPSERPEPTKPPEPTRPPEPSKPPEATEQPRPSERPEPTKPPEATERPEPTKPPEATERPEPTKRQ